MSNLFFYKSKLNETDKNTERVDFFNVDKVIRGVSLEDGGMLVLLDDIHERIEKIPMTSNKGNIINYRTQKGTYQSEIVLSKDDAERFLKTFMQE